MKPNIQLVSRSPDCIINNIPERFAAGRKQGQESFPIRVLSFIVAYSIEQIGFVFQLFTILSIGNSSSPSSGIPISRLTPEAEHICKESSADDKLMVCTVAMKA